MKYIAFCIALDLKEQFFSNTNKQLYQKSVYTTCDLNK